MMWGGGGDKESLTPKTSIVMDCDNVQANCCLLHSSRQEGCPHDIFLISRQKHMLWVPIRSAC